MSHRPVVIHDCEGGYTSVTFGVLFAGKLLFSNCLNAVCTMLYESSLTWMCFEELVVLCVCVCGGGTL